MDFRGPTSKGRAGTRGEIRGEGRGRPGRGKGEQRKGEKGRGTETLNDLLKWCHCSPRSQHTLFILRHWPDRLYHSKSPLLPTCSTLSFEPASYITQNYSSTLFTLSQRPLYEHASLICYALLSPSIIFHCFVQSSKLTFSENLILHLNLFLFVGLIVCL